MNEEILCTKLITNQMILGKTKRTGKLIKITKPFAIIPDPSGIKIFPYDQAILGKEIEEITIPITNTIYVNEISTELRNTYLSAISGITENKKSIIV